jgi:hypothetical protein
VFAVDRAEQPAVGVVDAGDLAVRRRVDLPGAAVVVDGGARGVEVGQIFVDDRESLAGLGSVS